VTRPARGDGPGTFHHVFNRGIARRTVFESRADVRYFLSRLAREVRAGSIRVHAYGVMSTHFHILIESRAGELADAMRRVMISFVRRFNRERRRDGSLFRGRFGSRPVRTYAYQMRLVRYIDQNAPQARLASSGEAYPYGSASHFCAPRRPRWLECSWIDAELGRPAPKDRPAAYRRVFGDPLREGEAFEVERRTAQAAELSASEEPALLDLAPDRVLAWMRRKARLADGTAPGMPILDPARAEGCAAGWPRTLVGGAGIGARRVRIESEANRVGALRLLSRLTYEEIVSRTGLTPMQVRTRLQHFLRSHPTFEPLARTRRSSVGK
jgi:hypothetical protein